MQLSTISPAPRRCTSSAQSSVLRAVFRMRRTSPVNCLHAVFALDGLAVDADHERIGRRIGLAQCRYEARILECGRMTDIFSAPAAKTSSASATERIPPATQNGISKVRATRETHARSTVRPFWAGGNIIKHEFHPLLHPDNAPRVP